MSPGSWLWQLMGEIDIEERPQDLGSSWRESSHCGAGSVDFKVVSPVILPTGIWKARPGLHKGGTGRGPGLFQEVGRWVVMAEKWG